MTGKYIEVVHAHQREIPSALLRYYGARADLDAEHAAEHRRGPARGRRGRQARRGRLALHPPGRPALRKAVSDGATDVHIEPEEKVLRCRYRLDGRLVQGPFLPQDLQSIVVTRLKIMAEHEHLRDPRAAGRPHPLRRRQAQGRPARVHLPDRARRDRRLPRPGQGEPDRGPGAAGHEPRRCSRPSSRDITRPQRHHPGDRAHGLRQDHHPLLGAQLAEQAGHQDHHPRGSGGVRAGRRSTRPRSSPRRDSPSPRACARSCARTRTSSWWARSATRRRRRWPSAPR